MSKIDLFRMGIKNLWRRKLRTFLTVLGVIIGASSIIVMLSLGFGMSKAYQDQIEQMGSLTTINVRKKWVERPQAGQKEAVLDDKAIVSFKGLTNVVAVSPMLEAYGSIINGRYVSSAPIRGIDPESMEAFGFEVAEGRLLSKNDELTVVFGGQMKNSFYEPKARVYREPKINLMKDRMTLTLDPNYGWSNPGEKKPNYKEYKIKVAGVLTEGDWETGYGIYMPLTEVQKLIKDKEKAENIKPQPGRQKQ